mmetsp:Transcript_15082/g.42784  ORF Transcript_15082/g.42784 Transcript_15082/m.42784 type:complete len:369 (+) Transcript_15082:522-1628(+)
MAAQNKKAFRLTNIVFAVLHGFLLLVCIGALLKNDIVPYYYFETLHGRNIPDYPIYTAILAHALALMFHVSFAVAHEQVIGTGFSVTGTNGYHWGLQAVGLGGGLLGLMMVFGAILDTIVLALLTYVAVTVLQYYEDQHLNPRFEFLPGLSPAVPAGALHGCLVVYLLGRSTDNITDEAHTSRTAIVGLIVIAVSCLPFVIQRVHLLQRPNRNPIDTTAGDDEEAARGRARGRNEGGDEEAGQASSQQERRRNRRRTNNRRTRRRTHDGTADAAAGPSSTSAEVDSNANANDNANDNDDDDEDDKQGGVEEDADSTVEAFERDVALVKRSILFETLYYTVTFLVDLATTCLIVGLTGRGDTFPGPIWP